MYLAVFSIHLFNSLFILMFGRIIGIKGVRFLVLLTLFLSVLCSSILYYEICLSLVVTTLSFFVWLDGLWFDIQIGFFFDTITGCMIFLVCIVSAMVNLFSLEYMKTDPSLSRFMAFLSLFTFFMLFLVCSDNYVQLFVGWEGVGLASYLLINFWYTRILANKAAIKAMLINRIGDLALLIGISLLFFLFGSANYTVINALLLISMGTNEILLEIAALFLFIGAMGKSAQLGLHMWLPDAMEGPTPVSALIHAATMVTAGVFLVVRSSMLFENTPNILVFISIVGGLTCFFSAVIGAFQYDIKRIVAYSTCSQLGYMFLSCGMSNYNLGLFHLFNHGFFKALLFLSMGAIIHALFDEQDFRRMGGLINLLPFTYICVLIGSLALMAFPFLTGYYSKDLILEFAYGSFKVTGKFLFCLGLSAAFFTAFYSLRLIYWVFFSNSNKYVYYTTAIHEPSRGMFFSMLILSLFSMFIGYVASDAFSGFGSNFFGSSLYVDFINLNVFEVEFYIRWMKLMPLFITILGCICFFFFFKYYFFFLNLIFTNIKLNIVVRFFSKAQYFDVIIDNIFFFSLKISYNILKFVEKGSFEVYGPFFVNILFSIFSKKLKLLNTGLVYYYIFLSLLSLLLCVVCFFYLKNISIVCVFFFLVWLFLYFFNVSSR